MNIPEEPVAGAGDPIAAGWEALADGAWAEAGERFAAALATRETAEALEGASWAAWWQHDEQATFEARERAYRLYRTRGDRRGAARMATWLGTDSVDFRGDLAVGQGWLARARRLLVDLEPGPEHGWLDVHEAEKRLLLNDAARARALGASATALGRKLGIVDLELMGLATEGLALVTDGSVDEGMSRLDEAAAAALGGEFDEAWPAAWCACYVLFACERVRDHDRAAQWCRRIAAWSERMRIPFVTRTCRAHYAGVLILRGEWEEAEAELIETAERLAELRPPLASEAVVRLAELRRRQGRLDEAAELFEEAVGHPLALLGAGEILLDRGESTGAREAAAQYLRDVPRASGTVRAPALELLIRASAAGDETAGASEALAELEAVAAAVSTESLRASARFARGVLSLAVGDHEQARTALEDATRLFHRSGAPFEATQARIELARALRGLGRTADAQREARAAGVSFRRLGAEREAERAEELARALETTGTRVPDPSPLTRREQEVVRLVAEGKTDRAIASALTLSEHTVHRHVANILAKLDTTSRSAAVAEALRRRLI